MNVTNNFATGSGITQSGAGKFPNPFFDIASEYVPEEITEIFEWCEFLYMTMTGYKAAVSRLVSYFLTEVVLEGSSDSERQEYNELLNKDMRILTQLGEIGENFQVYGNVFITVSFPFTRWFTCPNCRTAIVDEKIDYKYEVKNHTFNGVCPKCNQDVVYQPHDEKILDRKKVKLKPWNPKEIKQRCHPYTDHTEYYWEIPSDIVKHVEDNEHFYIADLPLSVLEAISDGRSNGKKPTFLFNEDAIFHMKEPSLAGVQIKGWGIPPMLPNFKLAYYIQILRRYDEAIAMDFIMPFRILYPETGGNGRMNDAIVNMNLGDMKAQMANMIAQRRKDPTTIHAMPSPIGYQMVGGEGKALAPKETLELASNDLLNSIGIPVELYKGTLTLQSAPVALRLFEQTQSHMVDGFNELLEWSTKKITRYFHWGDMTAGLRSVTLADDLERKALALQGAAGMDISKGTAYRPLGFNYLEEQKAILEEQEAIRKLQEQNQAEMESQQAALQGAMEQQQGEEAPQQAGGDQAGAEGSRNPTELQAEAEAKAQELLFNVPEGMRRGQIADIRASNPMLADLVVQEMARIRGDMRSEGGAQMMEQQKEQARGGQ